MTHKDNTPGRNYIFGWKEGILLAAVYFCMQILLGIVVVIGGDAVIKSDWFIILSYVLTLTAVIFAFDMLIVRPTGSKLSFNMRSMPFMTYALVLPMMIGCMFIGEFFTNLLPITGPFWGDLYKMYSGIFNSLALSPVTMILMTSVFAPVLEEIIFRGLIQKGLINKGVSPAVAIVVSSLVFGFIHGNPWQFLGASILGVMLGYAYYRTKSLLLPILLHAFNNLIGSLLIIYTKKESFAEFFGVSDVVLLGIGVVLLIVFGYLFTVKNKVHYND